MMLRSLLPACLLVCLNVCQAQIGGNWTYDFLNLSPSARASGLGGTMISMPTDDPALAFLNPASLADSAHTALSASYINLLHTVNYGTFAYAHRLNNIGMAWGGVRYFSYGTFTEADEFGNKLGTYSANNLEMIVGLKRSFQNFHFGMNVKALHASLYQLSSWGYAVDFGGQYYHPGLRLGVGASIRNMGGQFTTYWKDASTEPIPMNIEIGISHRLKKAPFRLSLTATNLNWPTLAYRDASLPPKTDLAGNPVDDNPKFANQVFRHLIFGLEILASDNFQIRFGYNHRRRAELKMEGQSLSFNGFSLGVGLRVKRFYLDYAFSGYHVYGGQHHIEVSTAFKDWRKKKDIPPTE